MRWGPTVCAIALSLTGSGCSLVTDSAHATSYWTHQAIQDTHERKRNRKLATIAWDEMRAAHPEASCDFEEGFKEGFADHLYRGTTQPPPVPPKQYRELKNQTTAGFRAGEEWLLGFRMGTEAAQASGLRVLVTGPSSVGWEGEASAEPRSRPQCLNGSAGASPSQVPVPLPVPRPANLPPAIEKSISIPNIRRESLRMPDPLPIDLPLPASPMKLEASEYIVPPKDLPPPIRQERIPDLESLPRFALPGFVAGRYQGLGSELVVKLQSRREPPVVVQVSFEDPQSPPKALGGLVWTAVKKSVEAPSAIWGGPFK